MVCMSTSSLKYTKPYLCKKGVGTRLDGNKQVTSKSTASDPRTHPLQMPPRYVIIFTSFIGPYLAKKSFISFSSTYVITTKHVSSKQQTFVPQFKYLAGLLSLPWCRFPQQKVCLASFCPPVKCIHLKV